MQTKVVRGNITTKRENFKDNFRVKYGDKNTFYLLKVIIQRLKDGSKQTFYFKSSQLDDVFDSLHFTTFIKGNKLIIEWSKIKPMSQEWKTYLPEDIIKIISNSIKKLQNKDAIFLNPEFSINERCVTHRLGMYLAEMFPDEDVDCEYNRKYNEGIDEYIAKNMELPILEKGLTTKDTEAKTVFPDIIVHRRNMNRNLLSLEVKMKWKKGTGVLDVLKAKGYKAQLNYDYSGFLILGPGDEYEVLWF